MLQDICGARICHASNFLTNLADFRYEGRIRVLSALYGYAGGFLKSRPVA